LEKLVKVRRCCSGAVTQLLSRNNVIMMSTLTDL
jgi:hypothetical protein